jgi:hypothetical protein
MAMIGAGAACRHIGNHDLIRMLPFVGFCLTLGSASGQD